MRKWKMVLIMVIVAVCLAGCSKPYLPVDFASNLDARIVELRALKGKVSDDCYKWAELDLAYLEDLRSASK
jgi:hypothetical protein